MLSSLWTKFRRNAFRRVSVDAMLAKASSQTELKRVLGIFELVMLGVGSMVGAGVFVVTGEIMRENAGPSVILSYVVSGFAALFCGLVYAEFAADIHLSGAAYNYVEFIFGEFVSWLAASTFLMEIVLSTAAVAKGLSGYFCTLVGMDSDALIITFDDTDTVVIDILGASVVLFLSLLLAYGVKESFLFNSSATGISLAVMLFIILASPKHADNDNFSPFFPDEFGSSGMFRGASIVFFAYIGFDTVANVAEDSRNPGRDLPMAIIISVILCTGLYILMAVALVAMVWYEEVDTMAAYSTAFKDNGWDWASRLVSFGALCGISTSLFGCVCSQSRLTMVLGREGFLPKFLGEVKGVTATPVAATLLLGVISATITLLFDIETLSSMVSMGTLFVYGLVAVGSLWRRYVRTEMDVEVLENAVLVDPVWVLLRIVTMIVVGVFEGLAVDREWPFWAWAVSMGLYLLISLSFCPLPLARTNMKLKLPCQPLVSCLGVLACVHLIVTLGKTAYIRFLAWTAFSVVMYFAYGLHREVKEPKPSAAIPDAADPLLPEGSQAA